MFLRENPWIWFVLLSVASWGTYVTVVHEGQRRLGGGNPGQGGYQAFVCIAVAYLILGVGLACVLYGRQLEPIATKPDGYAFAIVGGILGGLGALGITLALKNGGTPLTVPPLVFAGAPIVSCLVAMAWHPAGWPKPQFWVGMVMAAVGAALVLSGKPGAPPKAAAGAPSSAPHAEAAPHS